MKEALISKDHEHDPIVTLHVGRISMQNRISALPGFWRTVLERQAVAAPGSAG